MAYKILITDAADLAYGFYELDGDFTKVRPADLPTIEEVPREELNFKLPPEDLFRGFTMGRPIRSDHVPTRIRWDAPKLPLPDAVFPGRHLLVSDEIRDTIEQFEPGIHQFFPIEIEYKRRIPAGVRYLLNPCQRVDAVDPVHSRNIELSAGEWGVTSRDDYCIVLKRREVDGKHCWVDSFLSDSRFVSDELGNLLLANEFTGVKLRHYEEV